MKAETIWMFTGPEIVTEHGTIQETLDGWLATPLTDFYVPMTKSSRESAELYLELCAKYTPNKKRQPKEGPIEPTDS